MSLWLAFTICALIGVIAGVLNAWIMYLTYR